MKIYQLNNYEKKFSGGKASSLFTMSANGLHVPEFVVIPSIELMQLIESKNNNINDITAIKAKVLAIDESLIPIDEIVSKINNPQWMAVRSSAIDEDGITHSFAGQYDSFLFVNKQNLAAKIKSVWLSSFSEHIIQYRKTNHLALFNPVAVIIQKMIPSESSGVAFGINPVNGNRKQILISSVFGLGEGIVSGELNADNFIIDKNRIEKQIAQKEFFISKNDNGDTFKCTLPREQSTQPSLNDKQILEIRDLVKKCSTYYKVPQDIEFAYSENKLFLLQSRPITTLNKIPDSSGKRIIWDNSNIVESYPGVTTPLTFSFINNSYEGAYRLFLAYLGATKNDIEENKAVFANTLGLINGRVYYNLRSWYQMLAMLPGYSINASFMEKMMGVKEKFELDNYKKLSKTKAWWRIFKMFIRMYQRYRSLPRKRKKFQYLLNQTIHTYKKIDFTSKNANELMQLYIDFEKTLLNEWKAPLLNDFFAMIAFGKLQKRCEKYGLNKNNLNIHNDLLCGSSDIISVQPIHRSIALATEIQENILMCNWFKQHDDETVWEQLKSGKYPELFNQIQLYISDFGERCVGELKLETISYVQHPPSFIRVLRNYIDAGITSKNTKNNTEEQLRKNAQSEVDNVLKYKFIKKIKFQKTLSNARSLVSNRENLRYERTRAFGIVRELFSAIGNCFFAEGLIDSPRDIFYLTKDEIFSFISGTSVSSKIKSTIKLRINEYEEYKLLDEPSERIQTYGIVYHANDFFNTDKIGLIDGDLKGIGCCPGKIKARVKVIRDPKEVNSMNGEILVTSSTDPGWVTLFPTASAILVERGSLLSHSAIVAREMGIPCIVGISGLLRTLKTGDLVEMDGSTGQIKLIN